MRAPVRACRFVLLSNRRKPHAFSFQAGPRAGDHARPKLPSPRSFTWRRTDPDHSRRGRFVAAAACRRRRLRADDHVKREQAQAIMAEVEQLDMDLASHDRSWNYANIELDRIDTDLENNARHLVAAKKSLVVAQERIARLRDLYINGNGDSTLEVILGSSSLDDIISRLDAIERVSTRTRRSSGRSSGTEGGRDPARQLQEARADQARIVAEQAASRVPSSRGSRSASRCSHPSRTRSRSCKLRSVRDRQGLRRRPGRGFRPSKPQRSTANETVAQGFDSSRHPGCSPAGREPGIPGDRNRDAVPRHSVRLGRRQPVAGVRLLRAHDVRLRADRRLTATPRGVAVQLRDAGFATNSNPLTSSSSTDWVTWGCTSVEDSSFTLPTRVTWSRFEHQRLHVSGSGRDGSSRGRGSRY